MNLEQINCSLNDLFLGGVLFIGLEEPPARRGEISWIHYSPKEETLLVRVCYLAEEETILSDSWKRLVDYPYTFKFRIKENYLTESIFSLAGIKKGSLVMPDDEQEIEQMVEIFTLDNPWRESGLANFNSTYH
jgi:hypothetical protein